MKTIILIIVGLMLASIVYADGQINIAYSPYTISKSGSYIVVKDLTTAQNLTCIAIQTSNVTIDLNGHTLYGPGTTAGGSGSGITGLGYSNIYIMNGTVRDFTGSGISLNVGSNVQITKIKCYGNSGNGIFAITINSKIWDNVVYGNGGDGIHVADESEVSGNNVSNNGGYGILAGNYSRICNNSVYHNNNYGIDAQAYCVINNNCCCANGSDGIGAGGGSVITNNTLSSNSTYGISASSGSNVNNNAVYSNGTYGISVTDGCTVKDNTVEYNGGIGISVTDGCTVKDNTVRANNGDGIFVTYRSQVIGNTVSNNTTGIHVYSTGDANVVASNHITGNTTGIVCDPATNNYFHSNTLRFNITPTDIAVGNTLGAGDLANVSY